MSVWELPKDHYNWESPVTKILGDIHNEINRQDEEICMYTIEQAIGYKVDKEELIKALQYDRNQYEKGYNDGVKETFVSELEKIKANLEELANDEWNIQVGADKGLELAIGVIEDRISELKENNTQKSEPDDFHEYWDEMAISELSGDNKRSRCNNCKNNTDELSGECYECVKGIEDWYEPISELKGENK